MMGLKILLGLALVGGSMFADIPLFQHYPTLKQQVPYVPLGQWPTPVAQLHNLSKHLNINLFTKREDYCGKLFSGNKVRKLEFLLGDASRKNKKSVICYGGIASNNVVATSIYARQLGLQCIAFLNDQPTVENLKRNLILNQFYGCNYFFNTLNRELSPDELGAFLHEHILDENPYVIPMGSSNKIGIIGWVNAVFELKQQIDQGLLPKPDYIYVTFGSMGTVAGILLGIKAAGLETQIRAIQVTDPKKYTPEKLCAMIQQTNDYLSELDPAFARFAWDAKDLLIITEFFGQEFGRTTPEGISAQKLMFELENIILDQSYTAKTIAGLIHDAKSGFLKPTDTVLYWHTYCSDEFKDILAQVDPRQIPAEFQRYL